MKMSKFILAGAAVLLASVVVIGCKKDVTANPDKFSVLEKAYKFQYTDNNKTNETIRAYMPFGDGLNRDDVHGAVVKITANRPWDGANGLAFGVKQNDTAKTLDYFLLSVKTEGTKPYYYLTYYQDVSQDSISGGKEGSDKSYTIKPGTGDQSVAGYADATASGINVATATSPVTFYVTFKTDKDSSSGDITGFNYYLSGDAPTIDVSSGALTPPSKKIESQVTLSSIPADYKASTGYTDKKAGRIGAYGTVFKVDASGTERSSSTTFEVIKWIGKDGTTIREPNTLSAE